MSAPPSPAYVNPKLLKRTNTPKAPLFRKPKPQARTKPNPRTPIIKPKEPSYKKSALIKHKARINFPFREVAIGIFVVLLLIGLWKESESYRTQKFSKQMGNVIETLLRRQAGLKECGISSERGLPPDILKSLALQEWKELQSTEIDFEDNYEGYLKSQLSQTDKKSVVTASISSDDRPVYIYNGPDATIKPFSCTLQLFVMGNWLSILPLAVSSIFMLFWYVRRSKRAGLEAKKHKIMQRLYKVLQRRAEKAMSSNQEDGWTAVVHLRDELLPSKDHDPSSRNVLWQLIGAEVANDTRICKRFVLVEGVQQTAWKWVAPLS